MTDHDPDEHDYNELPELLAARQRAPRDVVPMPGLTRQALLDLDAAAGTRAALSPPAVVATANGDIVAVTATAGEGMVASPMVHRRALEAAGLTEADVPNLRIVGDA